MNRFKQTKQCAYCLKPSPETVDHIPPKNLFPKPRASNLLTVPCCESCRKGWSQDDEYFRAAILSTANVSEEPLAQGAIESLLRSLGREKGEGFTQKILQSLQEVEITTDAGIYLGRADVFKPDIKRLNRVSNRIIRGLFFHEKGYPIPDNYEILTRIEQFGLSSILKQMPEVNFPRLRIIQDGVFCYTFKETKEDKNSCIWLLFFYKNLSIIGFTRSSTTSKVNI